MANVRTQILNMTGANDVRAGMVSKKKRGSLSGKAYVALADQPPRMKPKPKKKKK